MGSFFCRDVFWQRNLAGSSRLAFDSRRENKPCDFPEPNSSDDSSSVDFSDFSMNAKTNPCLVSLFNNSTSSLYIAGCYWEHYNSTYCASAITHIDACNLVWMTKQVIDDCVNMCLLWVLNISTLFGFWYSSLWENRSFLEKKNSSRHTVYEIHVFKYWYAENTAYIYR